MHLDDLTRTFHELGFPDEAVMTRPPRDSVRAVQHAVERALAGDAFLVDCVELELAHLGQEHRRAGLAPFHVIAGTGIKLAFAYWAPGLTAGPHEHTDWTVTAVCHNALEVATYDRAIAAREGRLVQKNLFPAAVGRVGHIYDPCIHEPRNPTEAWTLSLHVFSPHDGRPVEDDCRVALPSRPRGSSDHPFARCAAFRHRERGLRLLAEVLAERADPRVVPLLERILLDGNPRTRRVAAAAIARREPRAAARAAATCARHAPRAGTRLASRLTLPLEVHVSNGAAELIAWMPLGPTVVLRVAAWAAPVLRVLASTTEVVIGDLPGGLQVPEQVALLEPLQELGLFADTEPVTLHL